MMPCIAARRIHDPECLPMILALSHIYGLLTELQEGAFIIRELSPFTLVIAYIKGPKALAALGPF